MKIKLAILEADERYLNRIVTVFSTKYADMIEIYSFTDKNIALATLEHDRIDVFIADEVFDIDINRLPKRCGFAYFADNSNVDYINDQYAICKFQKAELIYKQILDIYSEKAGNASGFKLGNENSRIIAFASVAGGDGASSMAVAAAMHFAAQNNKTIYLNLEKLGSSDSFLSGAGQYDMSDIIFALKSRKANIPFKLESCVKQDKSGVYFYSQTKLALDMYELTAEDIIRLLSELKLIGTYDYIIVDLDFGIDSDMLKILELVNALVWVGSGSDISNRKIERAYNALSILDQNNGSSVADKLYLIYNKFSSKTGKAIENTGIKSIGGAPRYEHASVAQVLEQLYRMDVFDQITL